MSNAMWGGRFESGPAAIMEEINASVEFDQALWRQDIAGSRAHVKMLAQQGIVTETDCAAILKGLDAVAQEIESGQFQFTRALEDVHMNVESRLSVLIGAPAGRLHTARSRNDQVATDMRLWVRECVICNWCWRKRHKTMPPPSCPASPICNPPSRSPSVII